MNSSRDCFYNALDDSFYNVLDFVSRLVANYSMPGPLGRAVTYEFANMQLYQGKIVRKGQ